VKPNYEEITGLMFQLERKGVGLFATVNTKQEFVDFHRRLLLTENLLDVIDTHSKAKIHRGVKQDTGELMRNLSMTFSILLVFGLSAVLVVTGIKLQPGIGIIGAVVTIPLLMWIRGDRIADIGLQGSASSLGAELSPNQFNCWIWIQITFGCDTES
jgi:hypothetical protein